MTVKGKLRKGMDEVRADLGNPEITDGERLALKGIIDRVESALMPLAELSDELKAEPRWPENARIYVLCRDIKAKLKSIKFSKPWMKKPIRPNS